MWKEFDYKTIEEGVIVLAYHPDWQDEEFCPTGVREGYYCGGEFFSAQWNNSTDDWYSTEGFPTHYMEMPTFQPPIDPLQLDLFEGKSKRISQFKDLKFDTQEEFKDWRDIHTKFIIDFYDYGIDLTRFYVAECGEILDSDFNKDLYVGRFVDIESMAINRPIGTTYQSDWFVYNDGLVIKEIKTN